MSEGAQGEPSLEATDEQRDPKYPYPVRAPTDFSGTPPYGGSNGTLPDAEGFNEAKPQPVNGDWSPVEQMAALEDALRNREAPASDAP